MNNDIEMINGYWRASNYITVALMYLRNNLYLKRKLEVSDLKEFVSGHWGTCPGINFIIAHLYYFIKKNNQKIQLIIGPGHAGNALFANLFLEGTIQKYYKIEDDTQVDSNFEMIQKCIENMRTEINPSFPGMIYDGGELGYSLPVAFGASKHNSDIINVCIIGDGEFETGTISSSWRINSYYEKSYGMVLPIIHLNGFRMGDNSILNQYSDTQIISFFSSMNYEAKIISLNHIEMINALTWATEMICFVKEKKTWPVIVLKSDKGMTAPDVPGIRIQGCSNSHKNPLSNLSAEEKINYLQLWLESYHPEELFEKDGKLVNKISDIFPNEELKIGNALLNYKEHELDLPEISKYAVDICLKNDKVRNIDGIKHYLVDLLNKNNEAFLVVSPDELKSNLFGELLSEKVLERHNIIEILNENICQALMQGYIMTGKNSLMISYEAFMPIITSMVCQYAKWLHQAKRVSWRFPVSSMNYLLTSVWETNTYSHQNPAFINHVMSMHESFVRVYFPIDSNTALIALNKCLLAKEFINLIVVSKQNMPQYLSLDDAERSVNKGIISLYSTKEAKNKTIDIIFVAIGDYCARECKEALAIIREYIPLCRVKFNIVLELTTIGSPLVFDNALRKEEFDTFFPKDTPMIVCYHGYADTIESLLFSRGKFRNVSILGYKNESLTSADDLSKMILNGNSRFDIVLETCRFLKDTNYDCSIEFLQEYCIGEINKVKAR